MKQLTRLVSLALIALLTACTGGGGEDQTGDHHIVVTTNILGDVVRNVVGDTAEVTVLMKPNSDPHSFGGVSAQEAAAMVTADLVVYNGLGLEESLQRHVDSAAESGVPTFAVAEHVDPIPYASGDAEGVAIPISGRIRTACSPRWTRSSRLCASTSRMRTRPARGECVAVPGGAEHIGGLDGESVRDHPPRRATQIGDEHHVLGYLAARYGFTVIGAVVPSGTTLASPSSSDLDSLAGAVRDAGVPAIFVDSSHPDRLARVLAEDAGVDVDVVSLYSESLDEPGRPRRPTWT